MILEDIHTAINSIVNAYPLVGDIEATTPFAVYQAEPVILRDKTGICGYSYRVIISVVDAEIADAINYSTGIKTAIEALVGATGTSAVWDKAHYNGESQRFDADTNVYINDIEYNVFTQNV